MIVLQRQLVYIIFEERHLNNLECFSEENNFYWGLKYENNKKIKLYIINTYNRV